MRLRRNDTGGLRPHRRQLKEFRFTYFTEFRQKTRHCERSEAMTLNSYQIFP